MQKNELKLITEKLLDTFEIAGEESINLFKKGLKIEIKEDKSPVSNGDLKVKASANSIKRYDNTQPALILEGDVKITFYDIFTYF